MPSLPVSQMVTAPSLQPETSRVPAGFRPMVFTFPAGRLLTYSLWILWLETSVRFPILAQANFLLSSTKPQFVLQEAAVGPYILPSTTPKQQPHQQLVQALLAERSHRSAQVPERGSI
ncbi:hypothetical protein EYF80_017516 [Liparis tanakae]|uniref:Uncharacterized protein n=1 Tax=Liparis tanakae TaxID=230148 RepID=A0A4Z2I4P9_9TELE|nr:hypothetical protein EYF80_017516 [Liparis tanakae]